MERSEIIAAIHQIEQMEAQLAALKETLLANVEVVNEAPIEEPQVEEPVEEVVEIKEEAPAPKPAVSKEEADEETVIGCQILSKLPDFYRGSCRTLILQKQYHDNIDEGYDKLYINKYKVVVTAEDIECNVLGSITVHWDTLAKWHPYLLSRGINKHYTSDNPHKNWMPKEVTISID